MEHILPLEAFGVVVGGIVEKAQGEALKTQHLDTIQLYICMPVIIIGLVSNALVLWIWLSVKMQFYDSVYLFRALAIADFLFVASYTFARLHKFRSDHIRLFFSTICYGNRYISNYITLILAISRFIRLFCPLKIQKMLSHFRLRLSLMLITCFILSLTANVMALKFFNAQKSINYYNNVVIEITLTIMPALAQNVLMLMVVFKLRQFSNAFTSLCDANVIHLSEQKQCLSEQENKIQSAQKLGISSWMHIGHLLSLNHRETLCDAGPRGPQKSMDTGETAQSDQTAGGQLNTKQRSVVSEGQQERIQERDPIPEAEPQNAKQGHSMRGPVPGPSDDRNSWQPESASSKLHYDIDTGVIYVVLAMCLCTFVSEVFCPVVITLFYHTNTFNAPLASFTCNIIIVISHSINMVFYLFINRFRQTLIIKGRRLMGSYTSTSVKMKATHPTTGDSEGRSFYGFRNTRLPQRLDDMTDSKLNACSSSKFPYGREGMAASPVSL